MKNLSKEELKEKLLLIWTETHHIPFFIERKDDRQMLLNNDCETYSFVDQYGRNIYRYTYLRLFDDHRIMPRYFKVTGWAPIDNIVDFPEKYFTNDFQKTELDERE